jgi:hypothetical protein
MAVSFNSIAFMRIGSNLAWVGTPSPLTFAARVKPASAGGAVIVISRSFAQGFEDTAGFYMQINGPPFNTLQVFQAPANFPGSVTAGGTILQNAWNNVVGVFPDNATSVAWCNGTAASPSVGTPSSPTVGELLLGTRFPVLGPFLPYNGCMGECAVYGTAWGADQQAAFNAGVSLRNILPAALLMYMPMYNSGNAPLNLSGEAATLDTHYGGSFTTCVDGPRQMFVAPAQAQQGNPLFNINLPSISVQGQVSSLGRAAVPEEEPPSTPCLLQDIIPSYLYQEYNDDDDLQAFVRAYNTYAQSFLDWFTTLDLPIYTKAPVEGALLDWVAKGLYGIARPALPAGGPSLIGPYNTDEYDDLEYNGFTVSPGSGFDITDDIFRRIITWHFFKGDCKVFDVRWLKRRIMRFLLGTDGINFNVDTTYQVSVTFGPGNQVNINLLNSYATLDAAALYNDSSLNLNVNDLTPPTLPSLGYNEYTSTVTPLPPLPNAALFKALVDSGYLELPFQFTYVVHVTT